MPGYLLQLLIALALAELTWLVGYPLELGRSSSGQPRHVDALDAALLMFALINLRLGWSAANAAHGGRAPGWFILAALLSAALITYAMLRALTPS